MKTKKTKPKKSPALKERALAYIEGEKQLLDKLNIAKKIVVVFPNKKKTPFFGAVGIWLIKVSGGIIDLHLIDKK